LYKEEYDKKEIVEEYPHQDDVTPRQFAQLIVDMAKSSGELDRILAGQPRKPAGNHGA